MISIVLFILFITNAYPDLVQDEQTFIENKAIIDKKQTQKANLIGDLRRIDRNITLKERRLSQLNTTLAAYNHELKSIQDKINQTKLALSDSQVIFEKRIRTIYKYQNFGFIEVLLSSDSIMSFFEASLWFEKLLMADITLLNDVKKKYQAWVNYNKKIQARKTRIQQLRSSVTAIISETAEQKALKATYVDKLSAEIRQFEAANQALLDNSAELEALIKRAYSINTLGTLNFIKPVIGWISSQFGYRLHPIFKRRIFHGGVDFAAPHGHKIMAADRGTVLFTGWWGGYGKATILDHGNDITTVYAHQSRIIIKKGDTIEKGQVIGYIGSTGYSTGPHLHFETRKKGKPIDPMAYFNE